MNFYNILHDNFDNKNRKIQPARRQAVFLRAYRKYRTDKQQLPCLFVIYRFCQEAIDSSEPERGCFLTLWRFLHRFSISKTKSGIRDSPTTVAHCPRFRDAVLKIAARGATVITEVCSSRQRRNDHTIFLLLNTPTSNRERELLILKAWTSWEILNTAKAIVRPIVTSK